MLMSHHHLVERFPLFDQDICKNDPTDRMMKANKHADQSMDFSDMDLELENLIKKE